MTRVHVSNLTGRALDWAVAYGMNGSSVIFKAFGGGILGLRFIDEVMNGNINPSGNWSQLGPLISACGIKTGPVYWPFDMAGERWFAICSDDNRCYSFEDKCQLTVCCRAIVASKLGEWVDVPDGLVDSEGYE